MNRLFLYIKTWCLFVLTLFFCPRSIIPGIAKNKACPKTIKIKITTKKDADPVTSLLPTSQIVPPLIIPKKSDIYPTKPFSEPTSEEKTLMAKRVLMNNSNIANKKFRVDRIDLIIFAIDFTLIVRNLVFFPIFIYLSPSYFFCFCT